MKPIDEDTVSNMDCRKVESHDIIERYLRERLSKREVDAFEQHYLECPKCFRELKFRHAASIEFSRLVIDPKPVRRWFTAFPWQWAAASAAIALIIIAGILYIRPTQNRSEPAQIAAVQQPDKAVLEQLGAIDQIPPYIPGLIRGREADSATVKFQEGMALYTAQQYQTAIGPLSESARLDPQRQITRFYLGIAYLASDNMDAAIEQLSVVTAQDNPYSEDAHWFMAKAYLKKRDVRSTRTELHKLESLNSTHAAAARDLLKRIENF